MALRMVYDCEIVLQIGHLERGFRGERMILAKASHNPVSAQLFDVEVGMRERQSDDCCVNHAIKYFLGQLRRIAMGRSHSGSREQFFMQLAEAAK